MCLLATIVMWLVMWKWTKAAHIMFPFVKIVASDTERMSLTITRALLQHSMRCDFYEPSSYSRHLDQIGIYGFDLMQPSCSSPSQHLLCTAYALMQCCSCPQVAELVRTLQQRGLLNIHTRRDVSRSAPR